jgi:ABC-type Mn2+/Zn2+ transport system ATPase subunit
MSINLSRFCIKGLYHTRTIDVQIKGNKLILVGENGIGKSTVVNLIFFFLTRQWDRILEYDFDSIFALDTLSEIIDSWI